MTVSATQKFKVVSSSGWTWTDKTNLTYGNTGESYCSHSIYGSNGILYLSKPNFITALPNGTEFISLKVEFDEKSTGLNRSAKLTDGDTFANTSVPGSYRGVTLDGDASYWGLSGSAQQIFRDLKDGTTKFVITAYGSSGRLYIQDVYATLTYVTPDTKRASILIPMS